MHGRTAMNQFGAAKRAAIVFLIGAALSAAHTTFATAGEGSATSQISTADVRSTSSIGRPESLADNCYVDVQVVRGFRGKRVVLRLEECD
jgi:hypothetical protein